MASIREVPGAVEITGSYRICAIYFLCVGDEIIYVGKSTEVFSRIIDHENARNQKYANSKPFTHVHMETCPECDLEQWENYYIKKFKPPYNKAPLRRPPVLSMFPENKRSRRLGVPPIFAGSQ